VKNSVKKQKAAAPSRNAVVPQKTTNLPATAADTNCWLEVSAELDKFFGAPFLKFDKQGQFTAGDIDIVPAGTRCVAHVDDCEFGWRKWLGSKVADRRTGKVADGFIPPQRDQLGDDDPADWEIGDDGTRKDPWQFFASVPLTRLDTSESYNFSTSSKGGLRCVNGLIRVYGTRRRDRGEAAGLPVIELQPGFYKHRTYGKIFFPDPKVVTWTDESGEPLPLADDMDDGLPEHL
jgi:hypothetical protein